MTLIPIHASVYDDRICELGEGPLWHPTRGQLFWFDIVGRQLLTRTDGGPWTWSFPGHVSAAGWVDHDHLLIATETGLELFDIETGRAAPVCPLEAENPVTRSNDGRADPYGGFWIGTMGKQAERKAGAIYRYYKGELRQLYPDISIPNAICFSPDGGWAYWTSTTSRVVRRQRLSARDGWPVGEPEDWLNLRAEGLNPDGAVVDSKGRFWTAQWGANRVACYDQQARFMGAVETTASQASCPAFGGGDLSTLFVTSATVWLDRAGPTDGMTFAVDTGISGQAEHQVILG